MSLELATRFVALCQPAADRLPLPVQQWIARRAFREVMEAWGFSLRGFSDEAVVHGIRAMSGLPADRVIAATLYAEIRDYEGER